MNKPTDEKYVDPTDADAAAETGDGNDEQKPDDDDWGFKPQRSGMAVETKLGMGLITVLVLAFGFVAYRKYDDRLGLVDVSIEGPNDNEEVVVDADPQDESSSEFDIESFDDESQDDPNEGMFGQQADVDAFDDPQDTGPSNEEMFGEFADTSEVPAGGSMNLDTIDDQPQFELASNDLDPVHDDPGINAANDSAFYGGGGPAPADDLAMDPPGGADIDGSLETLDPRDESRVVELSAVPDSNGFDSETNEFDSGTSGFDSGTMNFDEPAPAIDERDSFDDSPATLSFDDEPVAQPNEFADTFADENAPVESDPGFGGGGATAQSEPDFGSFDEPVGDDPGFDPEPSSGLSFVSPSDQPVDDTGGGFAESEQFVDPNPAASTGQDIVEFDAVDDQPSFDTADSFADPQPLDNHVDEFNTVGTAPQTDEAIGFDEPEELDLSNEPRGLTFDDDEPVPLPQVAPRRETETFDSFEPVPRRGIPASDGVYTVRRGDSFWSISKQQYGTARYYMALARFNQDRIPVPSRMRTGTEIRIPSPEELESRYPQLFRNHVRHAAAESRLPAPPKPARSVTSRPKQPYGLSITADGPVYRVRAGDTLSGIAQRHLGRASRSIQIFEMNRQRLPNPDNLKTGIVLWLPADASDVGIAN